MNQHGVTFLEVIVVIAILMIVTSLVSPNITDWRQKRALESDFQAISSQIDYLKNRARVLNGTATLACNSTTGKGNVLTYQVSLKAQPDLSALSPQFAASVVEDPSLKDPTFNIVSGRTGIISTICAGVKGIFLANGQSGLEGGNGSIDLIVEPADKNRYGAYRLLLNQNTGFVQKFKWNSSNSQWMEIE